MEGFLIFALFVGGFRVFLPVVTNLAPPDCSSVSGNEQWPTPTPERMETEYRRKGGGAHNSKVTEYIYEASSISPEYLIRVERREFDDRGNLIYESHNDSSGFREWRNYFDLCNRKFYSVMNNEGVVVNEYTEFDDKGRPVEIESFHGERVTYRTSLSYESREVTEISEDVLGDGTVDKHVRFVGGLPCSTSIRVLGSETSRDSGAFTRDRACLEEYGYSNERFSAGFGRTTTTNYRSIVRDGLLREMYMETENQSPLLLHWFLYDKIGNVVTIIRREETGDERLRYQFRYDQLNRPIEITSIWHNVSTMIRLIKYDDE